MNDTLHNELIQLRAEKVALVQALRECHAELHYLAHAKNPTTNRLNLAATAQHAARALEQAGST